MLQFTISTQTNAGAFSPKYRLISIFPLARYGKNARPGQVLDRHGCIPQTIKARPGKTLLLPLFSLARSAANGWSLRLQVKGLTRCMPGRGLCRYGEKISAFATIYLSQSLCLEKRRQEDKIIFY